WNEKENKKIAQPAYLGKTQRSIAQQLIEEGFTDAEIADQLKKPPELINKFRTTLKLSKDDDYLSLRKKLHEKNYWEISKRQFDKIELLVFEERWIETMIQYKEDVTATEEQQIRQAITLEILMDRCSIEYN